MSRPLNSTKPLYNHLPLKVGRPTKAKLTIGYLGPDLSNSQADDVQRALIIGQTIANHKQVAAIFAEPGTAQAVVRGIRDKAGMVVGFSDRKNQLTAQSQHNIQGIDTTIYTGSSLSQHKLFLESLDALIIQTYAASQFYLRLPLPRAIPVGVLVNNRQTTQQITSIVELAHPSGSPIEYAESPQQLTTLIIRQAREHRIKSNPSP